MSLSTSKRFRTRATVVKHSDDIFEYLVPLKVRQEPVSHLKSGPFRISSNGDGTIRLAERPPACGQERFEAIGILLVLFADLMGDWLDIRGHDLHRAIPFHVRKAIPIEHLRSNIDSQKTVQEYLDHWDQIDDAPRLIDWKVEELRVKAKELVDYVTGRIVRKNLINIRWADGAEKAVAEVRTRLG